MSKELYLLQNVGAGYLGNSPLFWAEGGSGYTQWIDEAKVWSSEEALSKIRETQSSHTWRMWLVSDVEDKAKRAIDIQDFE